MKNKEMKTNLYSDFKVVEIDHFKSGKQFLKVKGIQSMQCYLNYDIK